MCAGARSISLLLAPAPPSVAQQALAYCSPVQQRIVRTSCSDRVDREALARCDATARASLHTGVGGLLFVGTACVAVVPSPAIFQIPGCLF